MSADREYTVRVTGWTFIIICLIPYWVGLFVIVKSLVEAAI